MPRWLELVVAGLLLVLLLPALAVLALLVLVTSGRPVLYRQERVGRGGRTFTLLKLRTMTSDADRSSLLTVGDDVRITRVGRLLRDHRLDELPQVLNVLRGDMSLVGPRPEVPRYLGPSTPHYDELVRRRPGLTDPASLAYRDEAELLAGSSDPETYYRDVILPAKIQLSVDYARQRTVSSDLKVLATTATRVLLPHR